MWRWIAALSFLSVVHAQTDCRAQENVPSLLAKQDWVRFDLVLGRLRATHLRVGHGRSGQGTQEDGGVREALFASGVPTARSLRYVREDPTTWLELRVQDRNDFSWVHRFTAPEAVRTTHFSQRPGRPVVVQVLDGSSETTYQFASVWHLWLNQPDVAEEHLSPVIKLIRPDWRLPEKTAAIQSLLFSAEESDLMIEPAEVRSLVADLGAAEFSRRQAADQQLRAHGVGVLPYLQSSSSNLSGEQRLRMRRIKDQLTSPTADTPLRVAAWLANDQSVWLELLSHADPSTRQLAIRHLRATHDRPVTFDPLAEASERQQQLAVLRSVLGRR